MMYQDTTHQREVIGSAMSDPQNTPKNAYVSSLSAASTKGRLHIGARTFCCALGRGGKGVLKREGDGLSPIGRWPVRQIFYRADKMMPPQTRITTHIIELNDGWCDDPADRNYNEFVKLPYPASAENLWRDDQLYDIVLVLGYNDGPRLRHRGSAIFMHIAKPGYQPTEGCIALEKRGLLQVLSHLDPDSMVHIGA